MGTFKFGRRKQSVSKSSKSSLKNEKESTNSTPNSKAASSKSVPTTQQLKDVSKESPLKNKSRKISRPGLDVGNQTEPILSPRSNSAINTEHHSLGNNYNNMSKSPLMPEITSIKSQRTSSDRPRSLFHSRRGKHGELMDTDDDLDVAARTHTTYPDAAYQQQQQQPRFNSQEPALLNLPLIKTDSLPVTNGSSPAPSSASQANSSSHHLPLHNDPIAESSPNQLKVNTKNMNGGSSKKNSFTTSEIETPIEVEAHMANTDSTLLNPEANNTGIFSTFMSAAHNAASHIGNIASSHPEEFKSHPPTENNGTNPNNSTNENGGGGTSFMQHLDSLLFAQPKNKSREASTDHSQNTNNQEDDANSDRSGSPIVAHDVVFQPVRKNALSTMGKGELTLEALGFTDASLHTDRSIVNQSNQVPTIAVDNADDQRMQHSNSISGSRDLAGINGDSGANGAAMSKVVSGPGALGASTSPVPNCHGGSNALNNVNRDLGSVDPKAQDGSFDTLRSNSPVSAFRRSISPSNLKASKSSSAVPTQDSLAVGRKGMHRRSVSSVTEPQNGLDPTITSQSADTEFSSPSGTPMSASFSTTDLKDYSFANKKRDKEFHSMFKKIPKGEKLLDDYSCALQRDILVQGRMYVTERHICFNANILGWTTSINIPIQEIVQLEKKNTAGLFPNGIVIQTLHQKYVFASFLVRDTTFDLITNIWVKLVRGPTAGNVDVPVDLNHEYSQSDTDSNYNSEDGYSSDDDDFDVDDDSSSETGAAFGPSKHAPTDFDHKEMTGETKVKEDTIEAPMGKVFNSLFGDDTSFFKKILEVQKNKEISPIPKFIQNSRKYTYIKPLNSPVGPKETSCQVSETIEHKDFQSYILVTQITKTPDVPSGGSFSTNTQIYLSWGPKNTTSITVYTSVQWTAKSWIKGAVEKGSVDGQKDSMNILVDELKSRFADSYGGDSSDSNDGGASSLPTIGPAIHEATDNEYKKATGETQISDETFNAPLGTIYSILFGDDSSYFKSILEAQKNFDISTIPNFESEGGLKQRKYQYIKPLSGPIGPKQTKCLITETIDHFDINKYILVTQATQSPDVPSGNSFTVQTKFYFSWAANNTTRLFVVTSINWTGKSWVKGPIEKGTIDGQNESIGIMNSELKSILSRATSGKKSRKRSKTKSRTNTVKESDNSPSTASTPSNYPLDLLNQFSSPYAFGGLVFITIFIYFIFRIIISPSQTPASISIDHVQKIMIGGREYMIMPSVDDSLKREKLREETEYEVWKWINQRTKATAIQRDHKHQELSEMVNLAEQHLRVLKDQISRGDDSMPSDII